MNLADIAKKKKYTEEAGSRKFELKTYVASFFFSFLSKFNLIRRRKGAQRSIQGVYKSNIQLGRRGRTHIEILEN